MLNYNILSFEQLGPGDIKIAGWMGQREDPN